MKYKLCARTCKRLIKIYIFLLSVDNLKSRRKYESQVISHRKHIEYINNFHREAGVLLGDR